MEIRLFKPEDAEETALVIEKTLRVSNSKDYPEQFIEDNIASHSADELIKASKERHMYVICDEDCIIGTAGSPVTGAASPRVFCLPYLFYRSIKDED